MEDGEAASPEELPEVGSITVRRSVQKARQSSNGMIQDSMRWCGEIYLEMVHERLLVHQIPVSS